MTLPLMRELIRGILSSDPEIEVVGAVCDPLAARQKIKEYNPDVLTLDIEMPRMDGITFLDKIMTLRPMPVVMISSLTQEGAEATIRAREVGAVDFVAEPEINLQAGLEEKRAEIVAKVKAAANAPRAKAHGNVAKRGQIHFAPGGELFLHRENCGDRGLHRRSGSHQPDPPVDASRRSRYPCHSAYAGKFYRKLRKASQCCMRDPGRGSQRW